MRCWGGPVEIHADDLDCSADGRWLRGVSIPAGSSALTVPTGSVLDVDVGKSISIPGAVDMVATIRELTGAKAVQHAAISLGSPNLTLMLATSEEPFVPHHEGWRIVVDGAGPGGLPLLT